MLTFQNSSGMTKAPLIFIEKDISLFLFDFRFPLLPISDALARTRRGRPQQSPVAMPHVLLHHHLPITTVHLKPCSFPTPKPTAHIHLRTNPTTGATIKCMANPRRVKMVAKQIRRELSDMLLTDKVLQYAILPEAALGADRYLSSLTTISDVEVSTDLQVVKVYVSVFGDERGKEIALAGLKSKAKYVRSELGKRMKLRLTPEIRFIEDESQERGSRVIAILDKIKAEKKIATDEDEEEFESSDSPQDDRDCEGDDPDEGDIIYVK